MGPRKAGRACAYKGFAPGKTLPQAGFIPAEEVQKGLLPGQGRVGGDAVAATLILEGYLTRKRQET